MSEIEKLLMELRGMKEESHAKHIANTKATWSAIGRQDLEELQFETVEEMQQWISQNPYSNLI
jgi:hypothetical protein